MLEFLKYFVAVILLILLLEAQTYHVTVQVKQGTLIGTRQISIFDGKTYFAFYGIPYARAPVRKLRFKDPVAAKKWKQPFAAQTEHRGACAQAHIVHKHAVYGYEDCLHLSIYTPSIPRDDNPNKAVVVWIHGYAFTSSFSHIHGGDFFIDNDVILITVTHRIGPFGFLTLNQTAPDANMGLKDIIMALKWIKRNVKVFGGDKNNITVMGNGSAATFLSLLLTTKFSNLFSKIILQSGAMYSPSLFLGPHDQEKYRLQKELKRKGAKHIKRALTADIIAASQRIFKNREVIDFQKPLVPFVPIIEPETNTSLITKTPQQFFDDIQSSSRTKPILIGFNSGEGISEIIPFLHNPHLLKTLENSFKYMVPFEDGCRYNLTTHTYKIVSDKIRTEYFRNGITIESFLRYTSDLKKYPVYKFIKNYVRVSGSRMYVYKFNFNGKFNAFKATAMAGINVKVKGASDGDEICYLLKCEPLWESYVNIREDVNSKDRMFIKQITELWSNFAKTGDPTPVTYRGNVTWPPMTAKADHIMSIGKEIKIINAISENNMFSFWNALYNQYYSPENCKKLRSIREEL